MQKNRIKSIIDKGGRKSLLSLIQDDLLPGFNDIEIPQDLYKPENYSNLKNFFLGTLDRALDDVNNGLPQNPKFSQNNNNTLNQPSSSKVGGKTLQERTAIMKAAGELLATGKVQGANEYKFTYKGSNDANSQKYRLTTDDNKNLMFRKDVEGSEFVPISQDDLMKELGFSATEGMTAAEKIDYYKNKKQ